MTPDKTLEELAEALARQIAEHFPHWQVSGAGSLAKTYQVVNAALQSATAAQQREVERLQEQLRTEREKYKELFMKAQDLVEELKSEQPPLID